MQRWKTMAVVLASMVASTVAGCGDDTEEASGGDLDRYCELQRELQSEGDAELLDAMVAAAPAEIAEEAAAVAAAYTIVLETGDHEAAEGVAEHEAAMHAFNEDRCDIPNPLEE